MSSIPQLIVAHGQAIGADRAILLETTEALQPLSAAKILKALVDTWAGGGSIRLVPELISAL